MFRFRQRDRPEDESVLITYSGIVVLYIYHGLKLSYTALTLQFNRCSACSQQQRAYSPAICERSLILPRAIAFQRSMAGEA